MIPPDSIITCDTCPNTGLTSGNGALPIGWTYRMSENDDVSVLVMPYCPDCTRQRTEALERLRQEHITQALLDRVDQRATDDPVTSPVLDRQHLRREAVGHLIAANASINLVVARLADLKSDYADNAREIRVLINTLRLKIEDNP